MEMFYWGLGTSLIITISIVIATVIAFTYGYKAGLSANKELKDKTK